MDSLVIWQLSANTFYDELYMQYNKYPIYPYSFFEKNFS